MKLVALGLNHKTSNIDIREKFFLNMAERELFLTELKMEPLVMEVFVVSTCNRTEIYALMSEPDDRVLINRLCSIKKLTLTNHIKSHFYTYYERDAVEHLFNVTAGLDSLVVGEKEILGQVKLAVELARKKQTLGRFLNILTNVALRTGKRARSQTKISFGGSSVSWAAVEKAKAVLGTLEEKTVLIVGAGKMSHLAANDFHRKGVGELFIMNRTKEKGDELARKFDGKSVGFWEIEQLLAITDVCICSISAPHYVIETELVSDVMKTRTKDLVLIDISMPRNIHPGIASIKGVQLVGLDELDKVVEYNVQKRQKAVEEVNAIIVKQCDEFYKKINPILGMKNDKKILEYA